MTERTPLYNQMSIAAREAIASGFQPVKVGSRSKVPIEEGWPSKNYRPEDFSEQDNIGVKLGVPGGNRIDVDCENAEVATIAADVLPPTGFIHERPSLPRSHPWYTVADGVAPENLKIGDEQKKTLVELRWTAGAQALIPPSVHPDGEQYRWVKSEGTPAVIGGAELTRLVRTIGALAILLPHYPPTGDRHDFVLGLSGFLLRQKDWDLARVTDFVRVLANHAKDEEIDARIKDAETTARNLAADNPATGGGRLREFIGDRVFDAFADALGITRKSNSARTRVELPLVESAVVDPVAIDEWPPETLDGDAISDLAHAVTDDTGIPMPFARENTNLVLGAISREKPDFQASVIFRCAATPL